MKTKELALWMSLGGLLRLVLMVGRFLWYDESYTGLLTRQSLGAMLAGTAGDVHPPLYYLIIWPLSHIPAAPEWIIRIPSLLLGVLSIWLMSRLAAALGFDNLLTRALVVATALAPAQVWYGSEARQYALLLVLFLLGALAVTKRRWHWFTLAVIAMAYTHNYGLIYSASLALFGLVRNPRDIWKIARAGMIGAIAWLPWGSVLYSQISIINGRYWIQPLNLGMAMETVVVLLIGFHVYGQAAIAGGMLGMTLIGISAFKRPPAALILLGIVPPALTAAAALGITDLWLFRGLIPAQPFIVVLALWPFLQAWQTSKAARLLFAVLIIPVLALGTLGGLIEGLSDEHDSAARAEQFLRDNWQPGDLIVHMSDGSAVHLAYKAADLAQVKLVDCDKPVGALTVVTRKALNIIEVDQLPDHGRVWLATGMGVNTPGCMLTITETITGGRIPDFTHHSRDYFVDTIYLVDLGN